MNNKIRKFFEGRYGPDLLGRDLIFLALFISILNLFVKSKIVSWIPFVISLIVILRLISKNFPKRYNENRIYALWRQRMKTNTTDRLKFKYFRCKTCKQRVRVPRGKGKVTITCPKCRSKFDGKS
ncbi:hypothetical protein ERUR111494_06810 [Erysipelothrix urinaevulpis]|uniref:hypothetical protein n=1 Tax=Erysipelothrix urinaevulpis TaxID=2683717 RepID=UPI00135B78FF|nr:hypothetical protein [Erysipelothrix urinaevulpis]